MTIACEKCGSPLRDEAQWCGLCYWPVPRAVPIPVAGPPAPVVGGWSATPVSAPPGWAPPTQHIPPPPPSTPGVGGTVVAAIATGAAIQGLLVALAKSRTIEPEAAVRYALVSTLGVYIAVTLLILARMRTRIAPLRWVRGSAATSAAIGVATGLGLALALMAVVTAITGENRGDPNVGLLMSEADFAHVVTTLLITVVAAPLVEEILFRGLFAESLARKRSTGAAVWISALAFSVWHLQPEQLRYYLFMGALLGMLWLKRGLVCSISAHAAFNGALSIAALLYVTAPGELVSGATMSIQARRGWHRAEAAPDLGSVLAVEFILSGPSAAELVALRLPVPGSEGTSVEQLESGLRSGTFGATAFSVDPQSVRRADLPAGRALRVRVTSAGRDGEMVMLPSGRSLYLLALASGGSVRARSDFDRMLTTLRVTP